jgi:phenylacetate-CoA ligase
MRTVQIPFKLLAGDGKASYGFGNVVCEFDGTKHAIPAEIAELRSKIVTEREQALGFELTNEPAYRLAGFGLENPTNGNAAQSKLHLRLQQTAYFDFVSTNLTLDRPVLADGSTVRAKYVRDITALETSPLANSMSVMVLLVSQPDKMALVPRRSNHVAFDQGALQASGGGAMRLAVDRDSDHLSLRPSPFVTAQREISEELGFRLPLEAVRFLGLGVDTRTGEPELLGVAETKLSVEQLRQLYREAQEGNDELSELAFVPFELEPMGQLLAEDKWCPGDWVCVWLALVEAYGADQVAQFVTWDAVHGITLPMPQGYVETEVEAEADLRARFKEWRKNLPLPVRKAYGRIRRMRSQHWVWSHPEFLKWYNELLETQWWSREQLEELQLVRLQALLSHSYEHVPYYRRIFDERKLKPADFKSLDDLQLLPILTKEDVRQNLRELVAVNIDPNQLYFMMTGGTSGTPLGFYHQKDVTVPHEDAFMYRQWSWVGYNFGDPLVYLRRSTPLKHLDKYGNPAWWDFNTDENSLVLSLFHLSEETFGEYVEKLRTFRPRFIQGFPSVLEMLSRYMIEHHITDVRPKAVLTECENLYPAQREAIHQAFACPVLAGYGHSERAVDAVECEQANGNYHVSMEYGILEITDEDGRRVPDGKSGFITGTGLDTHCMPFIRYQTDDVGRVSDEACACGRKSPLLVDIVGRWQHEVVITSDDKLVPVTSLNVHANTFQNVAQYQYYQERRGELIVRLVKLQDYTEADTQRILQVFNSKFRGKMDVKIVFLPEIARTKRSKHRMLEQKLDLQERIPQEA